MKQKFLFQTRLTTFRKMSATGSTSHDDEDVVQPVPTKEVAQFLVAEFAQITGTDTALAQMFLQDRQWDLEVSSHSLNEI